MQKKKMTMEEGRGIFLSCILMHLVNQIIFIIGAKMHYLGGQTRT